MDNSVDIERYGSHRTYEKNIDCVKKQDEKQEICLKKQDEKQHICLKEFRTTDIDNLFQDDLLDNNFYTDKIKKEEDDEEDYEKKINKIIDTGPTDTIKNETTKNETDRDYFYKYSIEYKLLQEKEKEEEEDDDLDEDMIKKINDNFIELGFGTIF